MDAVVFLTPFLTVSVIVRISAPHFCAVLVIVSPVSLTIVDAAPLAESTSFLALLIVSPWLAFLGSLFFLLCESSPSPLMLFPFPATLTPFLSKSIIISCFSAVAKRGSTSPESRSVSRRVISA